MVLLMDAVVAPFTSDLLAGLCSDPTERFWTDLGTVYPHGMFTAIYAGRSRGPDNLLATRVSPDLRVGLVARVLALAS